MSGLGVERFSAARATALGKVTSRPELRARELLTHFGLQWTPQVPIGRWVVDLMIADIKLAIEVHGAYWHDKPGAVERDARRQREIERLGYRVLILRSDQMHFWWRDLAPFVSFP